MGAQEASGREPPAWKEKENCLIRVPRGRGRGSRATARVAGYPDIFGLEETIFTTEPEVYQGRLTGPGPQGYYDS